MKRDREVVSRPLQAHDVLNVMNYPISAYLWTFQLFMGNCCLVLYTKILGLLKVQGCNARITFCIANFAQPCEWLLSLALLIYDEANIFTVDIGARILTENILRSMVMSMNIPRSMRVSLLIAQKCLVSILWQNILIFSKFLILQLISFQGP